MLVFSEPVFSLSGYRITQQIYFGSKTLVYRGIREQDQTPVVIKLMRNEYPTFHEIAQFRNQYTITKNLDVPGIVKSLSLESYCNGYALVMEDFGGISLKEWEHLNKDKNSITLNEFFPIAIAVTSTLEGLHRSRIIHKDIKPANILIHPDTLEIRLIDFSIASLLPREVQVLTNPNVLEGTLAYISPEQTGRMNRGIDYRSDFYSLGVTFFELLNGQLPFTTIDPMELVYCHIAKQPDQFKNEQQIPQALWNIVMKLMAKNAEDRYQSAYGIKYDLEICYKEWQETRDIASFELATKDVSDRFLIPEKLYGRQQEVATLLAAFERVIRGRTEIILVAGFSGIGKTAVVNEVQKPIVRQQSYFIKGKFDQFQRDIPLSGLVQAFRDLIAQILLETDAQIQQWKTKILLALGEQAQIIIDVIPELKEIIGKQPDVGEISGSAAQHRFNLLFQRFVQVFSTKQHPLVIFLDDLQWADAASLKFIHLLISQTNTVTEATILSTVETIENQWIPVFEGEPWEVEKIQTIDDINGGILFIGAYRNNEVYPAHPLSLTLKEIEKTGCNINQITLLPLTQNYLNTLITDTLGCEEGMAIPLNQMVFAKTKGNPFFATQFIKSLHHDGLIKFNFDVGYWQYDIAKIQALSLTDDVVEFMAKQIKKLPNMTQDILKLAACIGNEFDLKTLAIAYDKSVVDTASDLWTALHEGIILPQNEIYKLFQDDNIATENFAHKTSQKSSSNCQIPKYKFIHDRIQQAAYSLIPENLKKQIHLRIGRLLLNNIPVIEREENIFQLVNQLNIAIDLINNQSDRHELAQMNLIAGGKALASTAYTAAAKYLNTGIELLAVESWETNYQLTLSLYETAAEVAYLAGNFEQMEQLIQVVLLQAKTLLEKVKVYEVKIQAYTSQNRLLEAIEIARKALQYFGVDFPNNPSNLDIQQRFEETATILADKTIDDLNNLPLMTSPNYLTIMRLVSTMIPATYLAEPLLFPLLILSQVNLSVSYGNAPLSAFCYANYSIILNDIKKDIQTAYQFGKLALSLGANFNCKEITAKTLFVLGSFIIHNKCHIRETLPILIDGYQTALETGNLEFVGYCAKDICQHSYLIGQELMTLEQDIKSYADTLNNLNQTTTLHYCQIYWQAVINLARKNENPHQLLGEKYNEEENLLLLLKANDITGLHYFYFHKLILCYYFGYFNQGAKNAAQVKYYLAGGTGFITIPIFHFYDSLIILAIYYETTFEQHHLLKQVEDNQLKLKQWADHAPMNYLHKFYLVEAERYRILGQYLEAIDYYDRAISLAKENEYINEEALANELAGKFYLQWGKQKIAQIYLTDAYYAYSRWGAKAKVDHLVEHYSQLLTPILQQGKFGLQTGERMGESHSQSISNGSHHQTIFASRTSISDSLDLSAVIKASQALSGEIEIEQLLSTLMQLVMENAGASKSALILSEADNSELKVNTVSHSANSVSISTSFPSSSLENSLDVPITLINYVKRHREILVIDDAETVDFLAGDRYIITEQPQSLLCLPLINQSKLLGILYLENNLITGAFTRDRLEVLKLLTTQAAISIENARLYKNLAHANQALEDYSHRLEEKVELRTQELNDKNQRLQQALKELQRTQSQLIQSEKMSSLGQMIAGIAHEINNPINFIHGNITHARNYMQDLLELIAIYQQEYPNPSNIVAEKFDQIDINFLVKDLLKIFNSMNVGSSRIQNIVLGLRNFSRLDESEMKPVDIHQGIDNTLMILQHRFNQKSDRPEITVIKEYAKLPPVTCYAGQINQVFMNVLSNAIDALEESVVGNQWSFGKVNDKGELITNYPTIRICTELIDVNTLRIRIIDNGAGMTEAVREKIFDPFFTTKPVGSGTGLGLSISYQIVVEKHKGQLTCNSLLGEETEFMIDIPMRTNNN